MKYRIVLLLVLSLFLFLGASADRQKVYSVIKQKQPAEWYQEQSELWKTYLQTNKTDGDAWLNYYTAMRMKRVCGSSVSQKELDKIVLEIEQAIPNSFEYHYIAFWNSDISTLDKNIFHLKKAYAIAPERTETLDDFMTYYELKRDKAKLEKVSKKWYASNDMATGLYYWNYNVLQSLEQNAILITSGDNDTYPSWVLQHAKKIRTDVTILNHSLIGLDDYRNLYFEELGIPKMPFTASTYETYPAFQAAMMKYIKKNSLRPIYFAVSANPKLYEKFKSNVYNVGMAYKWSEEKFDNIAVIKKNYEKNYLIDYLKFNPDAHIGNGVVHHMNTNYLISLLPLYNHYVESDDPRKNDVEILINNIARKNNMEAKVAKILGRAKSGVTSYVINDPRKLEKGLIKIQDKLYANSTEVTNGMYDLFLTDLLKQKRYDDLNVAKANAVDWRSLLPQESKGLSDEVVFRNGNADAQGHPVVNISYKAAVLYCEWLTEVYNNLAHRKKKFESVEFRLPSETEWEMLAAGGRKNVKYPWGRMYVRNAKGCYLGNYNSSSSDPKIADPKIKSNDDCKSCTQADLDGGFFPVRADAYWPNDYGLYNMTGNVSEMVSERGIVKGGSWNTTPENATVTSREKINEPSPEVGFRVIMVVK